MRLGTAMEFQFEGLLPLIAPDTPRPLVNVYRGTESLIYPLFLTGHFLTTYLRGKIYKWADPKFINGYSTHTFRLATYSRTHTCCHPVSQFWIYDIT